MSLLAVRGLNKRFGGVTAVRDVSFEVARGEVLALIGPNGAGKSTCFNMLYGGLRPDSGSVRLEGTELVGLPPRRIWRLRVGRTFQITQTYASMTVVKNVQVALASYHRQTYAPFRSAWRLHRDAALGLLERVGMKPQADRAAGVLAYGDVKRLELAVALVGEPKLLLMDEPTAGMAPAERKDLMRLAAEIARTNGIGVLFTEHDMDVVFEHAQRVLVLNRGELVAQGSVEEVSTDPKVKEIYLGGGTTYAAKAPNLA